MTKEDDSMWKDCNCMNCRLARIEDNVNRIITYINTKFEDAPKGTTGHPR
ncbi:MAG: hypothetical protein JSW00_10555 [Thermoplasmata archaeon]|nr:MAG: hypothetical protein JSW00_10555 [Thermoplasmata archaeon]